MEYSGRDWVGVRILGKLHSQHQGKNDDPSVTFDLVSIMEMHRELARKLLGKLWSLKIQYHTQRNKSLEG